MRRFATRDHWPGRWLRLSVSTSRITKASIAAPRCHARRSRHSRECLHSGRPIKRLYGHPGALGFGGFDEKSAFFGLVELREAQLAFSRTTSVGFLSSRNPIKTGWRNRSSRVHSVNFTSEMMIGLTQTHRFISAAVNPGSRPRPVAGRLTNGQSLTAVLLSSAESNFRSFFAESGADSASKLEVPRFIDADQQGAHVSPFPGRLGISADHH
jgi:hypothetical protein